MKGGSKNDFLGFNCSKEEVVSVFFWDERLGIKSFGRKNESFILNMLKVLLKRLGGEVR